VLAIIFAAGATAFRALPSERKVSAAGSALPALAVNRSSRITVRPSGDFPELKLEATSDLAEIETQSLATARPSVVLAPDLDQDGHSDLVVGYGNGAGTEMRVRFGSTDGDLTLPRMYSLGSGAPQAIAAGEFTVDGRTDLIVAHGSSISLMAGTAEGEFVSGPMLRIGGTITRLAVTDADRDGLGDIFALDVERNKIFEVLGNGDLGHASPVEIAFEETGAFEIKSGDFNNDFFADLAIACDEGVAVLYGDGKGGFGNRRLLKHSGDVTGLVVGDLNRDHFDDIAISGSDGITLWATKLNKGFAKAKNFYAGEGARGLVAGFYNSDDGQDLAVINNGSKVSVLLNRNGRSFSEPMSMDVDGEPLSIATAAIGPYSKGTVAIIKSDGRTVVPTVAASPTINVSTLNDENDCPACTVPQLLALVPPGGGDGISLREAINAVNTSFLISGTTDQGIGFSGLSLVDDTPTPSSALVIPPNPPLTCIDRGVTVWRITPNVVLNPTRTLPAILSPGTLIDGTNATGATNTFGPKVQIAGWSNGFVFTSNAAGSVIRGLALVGNNALVSPMASPANAITVAANNVKILDNYIGLSYDGICIEVNTGVGVLLSGTSNCEVKGNLIAGNGITTGAGSPPGPTAFEGIVTGDEVQINGISLSIPTPQNNLVENNSLGLNKDNSGPLINPGNGVLVQNAATGNTIRNNVIGRNAANGVSIRHNITSNTVVENNKIGVDPTGLFPAPNSTIEGSGVSISVPLSPDPAFPTAVGNSKLNTITQNVISGNLRNAVTISSADTQAQSNVVASNKIGVDASGSVQIPNGTLDAVTPAAPPTGTAGVGLTGSADGNRIGGPQAANANQISGNHGYGMWIGNAGTTLGTPFNPNNNTIQNNKIGANSIGTGAPFDPRVPADPLPKSNKAGAVLIDVAAFANTLASNEIAFNADNTTLGAPPALPPTAASGITHSSTGNFNRFTQNNIFLNPPDVDPITPQIVDSAGNEGELNAQINNTALTSLIKIDSAVTTTSTGATTIKGTVNFLDNGILGNINNAKVEFFVSRRGAESPPLAAGPAQIRAEGQLFLNSVISFQPNSANLNTLDYSAQATIPAQFIPVDVQTQTVFLTATVTTGDNSTSPFSIGRVPQFVSGGGGGGGCALTANPTIINVLNAPIGQPTNRVLTLTNTGTTSVTITGVSLSPAGPPWAFDLGGTLPINLNPTETKNITVGFTPTSATPSTASLSITNSCTVAPLTIPLAGSGTSSSVGVSPGTLNFGTVPVTQTATLQVGVINFGNVPVTATPAINQTAGSGFSIASTAAFTIPPQSVVNFNVSFTPSSSGGKSGSLVFSTPSATPTSLTVNLQGTGGDSTPPVVVFSQPSGGSLPSGQAFQVVFAASDSGGSGLGTFTATLSTDGGSTFPFTLGTGTAIDGINTLTAAAPSVESGNVRIRVQVRDQANNVGTGLSNALAIGTPPSIIGASWAKKFFCQAAGSNIQPGAVLMSGGQSWPLSLNVDVWVVGKQVPSSPGGIFIRQIGPPGTTAVFTIRNPSGLTSSAVSVQRPN
jgi:hypothetical protein